MPHISVNVRLRPVRFAFLVRPTNATALLNVFRINTCLWGGKFNPIIPVIKKIPKWWDRHGHQFETAPQVLSGYLDFFEPDFLVESEGGLADALGFETERILQLDAILTRDGDRDQHGYGLSVLDLYRHHYRKEFQFTRRHEHSIVNVTAKADVLRTFCACLFGDFPKDNDLSYFEEAFINAFDPKAVSLDGEALADLFRSGGTSALRMGHTKLSVDYHDHNDPTLFVLDATKPQDLIDFWNLRATRRDILPIPVQWAAELSEFVKEFIEQNYRPLPGNPNGVMIQPTVMFARSIPTVDIDGIYNHFRVDIDGANARQDWYPPLWRPSQNFAARRIRPTLSSERKSIDIQVDPEKVELRFNALHPDFASEYGNQHRWANVVNLRGWGLNDHVATVYPTNHRNSLFTRLNLGAEGMLVSTEGFVMFPRYRGVSEFWRLPDGATAIQEWLKAEKIKTSLSDAGRATQQIVQTLGGFQGVSSIAHPEIVQLLNEISRRPGSRSIQHQELQNRIHNATKNSIWQQGNFERLVRQGAVELGLEIKCEKCSSWTWHPLKELGYTVKCGLCLQSFPFPIINPSSSQNTRWSYRLVGPFAQPDYARGGYAAALTLRFFSEVVGQFDRAQTTWSAGQELELGPKCKAEADVILWYQRRQMFGNDHPTEAVFAEVKSFGKEVFTQEDVNRMKQISERFLGSTIVFATMKEASEFTKDEIARLRKFAEWGREYIRGRKHTRAPVIVLTGTELFAAYHLDHAWKDKGGKHAEFAGRGWVRMENLRLLANLTQQLYLEMPSYDSWLQDKWKKRRASMRPVKKSD